MTLLSPIFCYLKRTLLVTRLAGDYGLPRQCNRVKLNPFSPSFQLSKYRKRRRYFAKDQSRRENSQVITFCLCNIGRASDIWPSVKRIFYFIFNFFFCLNGAFSTQRTSFLVHKWKHIYINWQFSTSLPIFLPFFISSLISFLGKGMIKVKPPAVWQAIRNYTTRYMYDKMLKV